MVIQHNVAAMNTNRQLGITSNAQAKISEKLSSGYKINRAADDAAGLTISEKMRSQIRGLTQASANAQDGISCVQTAEGALAEVHDMLQRMNELAVKAANGTNTSDDRAAIKFEIDALVSEIDRISSTTEFNTMNLLDGTFREKTLQVGSHKGQDLQINIYAIDAHGLGLTFPFHDLSDVDKVLTAEHSAKYIGKDDITNIAYKGWTVYDTSDTSKKGPYRSDDSLLINSTENAGRTIQFVQNAIDVVSEMRSSLGAIQNRLEHTISNLDNVVENTTAAESRIRDTDMAAAMVEYSRNNILAQAGQSMLAQANQSNQGILSLLG